MTKTRALGKIYTRGQRQVLKVREGGVAEAVAPVDSNQSGAWLSAKAIEVLAIIGDVLIISGTASLAHYIWLGDWSMPIKYVYPVLLQVLLCVNIFRWRKLYELETYSNRTEHLLHLAGSFGLIALMIVGMGFGFKTSAEFSRMWFGLWTLLALVGLSVWFVVRSSWVRKAQAKGQLRDRLLVVGSPQAAHEFTEWLDIYAPRQTRVMGVVTMRGLDETEVNGHRVLGGLEALPALAERLSPDKVVLLVDWSDASTIDTCLKELRSMALDVELVLPRIGGTWTHRHVTHVGGTPAINLMRMPLSEAAHMAKRVEDYVLAVLLLTLFSPAFLVIAGLIKASSNGPVFYRQMRVGFQKREFDIFKFRTMRVNGNEGFKQATRDDDRVTWIGKILRRTSLDELPQLLNVLRGEMSVVGPRPHEVSMNREYAEQIDDYLVRHKIRPGITGWAQVNGARGETRTLEDMERRIGYDLEYVDNWSVWFDIKILLRTAVFFLFHRNAY